ncbi:hypothetical protein [Nocardia puris]|uniref:hypothetical protein n=1 Tax=Nocardia puris TaxID=208602 RepID=UPI002E1DCA3D
MTAPTAADLAAWVTATRCEVGRTFMRRRPACSRPPDHEITRHDCDAPPPWRADSYICRRHLVELAALPYPYVHCTACGLRLPTFRAAVPDVRPIR